MRTTSRTVGSWSNLPAILENAEMVRMPSTRLATLCLAAGMAMAVALPPASATERQPAPGSPKAVAKPVPKPAAARQAAARPIPGKPLPPARLVPAEDQSFLRINGSLNDGGVQDYITSGMKHSNQPWFMTRYDRLGNWP
jgi:hypothetical protein